MEKILLFGNSASGKSTFARQLSTQKNIGHLDLDILAWEPGVSPPARRSINDSKKEINEFITKHKSWVIEGCYSDLLRAVADEANEIIFLNLPIEQCLENAKTRPWEPHKYSSLAAQNKNLPMLLDWIADYVNREDEFSYAAHQAFYYSFVGKKTTLTARPELEEILKA